MPHRFFAEISCVTSPVAGRPFANDLPRISPLGKAIGNHSFSMQGEEPEPSPYLRIREIELLTGYREYFIVRGNGRHLISFNDIEIADPQSFHDFARSEVARMNRLMACIFPEPATITLEDTIYQTVVDNELKAFWKKNHPTFESAPLIVTNNRGIIDGWSALLQNAAADPARFVHSWLELKKSDAVVGACVALVAQNDFPAFFKVFEIVAKEYGGQNELTAMLPWPQSETSQFKDNAQAHRHFSHKLGPNTREMSIPGGKLFVINLIHFYTAKKYGQLRNSTVAAG